MPSCADTKGMLRNSFFICHDLYDNFIISFVGSISRPVKIGFRVCLFLLFNQSMLAQSNSCNFLCNTDFDDEVLVGLGQFSFFHESRIACWKTTASDKAIEIWGSGFGGVPAFSGRQFAELNANMVSTLYQEFTAGLGGEVEIAFAHRGRAGLDRLSVEIGPVGGPYVNLGIFSADNSAWVYNKIKYNFPSSGRTDFTIRFNSVSAAGGATVGNFLDAISIRLTPPLVELAHSYPSCPNALDGSIVVKAVHGSAPFKYQWKDFPHHKDSLVQNLGAGVYILEVIDWYGCSAVIYDTLWPQKQNDSIQLSEIGCLTYTWPGVNEIFYQSGNYVKDFKNQWGCDSVVFLDLKINKPHYDTVDIQTCSSYLWDVNLQRYSSSGLYSDTLLSSDLCDSIITLDLTILPESQTNITMEVCNFAFSPVDGKRLEVSALYKYHLQNEFLCDSIVTIDLRIYKDTLVELQHSACSPFYWQASGSWISESGNYKTILKSQYGCDSILVLYFTKLRSDTTLLNMQSCESYFWPGTGKTYKQSGIYQHTLPNMYLCDSVIFLDLKIHSPSVSKVRFESCDSIYVPLLNRKYKENTIDSLFLQNQNGCDSTLIAEILIHHSVHLMDTVKTCGSYFWNVDLKEYKVSGLYEKKFTGRFGCDSVHRLYLHLDPVYTFYDTVIAVEEFIWEVNQMRYEQSGTYMMSFETGDGCDSLHYLFLVIRKKGSVWVPNVFSPNQDGVNDRLMVFSSPEIEKIDRFRIFDRWGELLYEISDFEPNNSNFGWDGRFKLEILNNAVFVCVVEWTDLLGQKRIEKTDATLIR